jgi:hypothetical protein
MTLDKIAATFNKDGIPAITQPDYEGILEVKNIWR